jgi:hypothetical protein
MPSPTPRDLDPKFKDATVPADQTEETTPAREVTTKQETAKESRTEDAREVLARLQSTEIPKDPNEGEIVYRQPFVDSNGTVGEKVHGPMPVSEWATYSKENGL